MTLSRARESLEGFINREQAIFQSLPITTPWESTLWSVEHWLPQRLKQQTITFETHRQSLESMAILFLLKLPSPWISRIFARP